MEIAMSKKSDLPAEIHDHFRKATILHGYVEEHLGKASEYALEAGEELLAAKKAVPHGRWETECGRLFAPSARTARFYMQFARNMGALPKRQRTAILMIEGTLDGAAKAARAAARPATPAKPSPPAKVTASPPAETQGEGPAGTNDQATPPDLGKCPSCAGTKWTEDDSGVVCAKCHHPHGEPAGDVDDDRLKTQRQKTVKTVEALMRAFDDLQTMKAHPRHDEAINNCKLLLKLAKGWT
jgi:hypothetical protein